MTSGNLAWGRPYSPASGMVVVVICRQKYIASTKILVIWYYKLRNLALHIMALVSANIPMIHAVIFMNGEGNAGIILGA